ncbi:penicillin acylase family protein [Alkalicaulis satelles]|nr:penicillin acylase family protein [Alkalicaulis satelles]
MNRIVKLALFVLSALVFVMIGVLFVLGLRLSALELRSFDPEAAIEAASRHDAEITRDAFGVPRVIGAAGPDAAFALAFAHAEDDFPTVQDALRQALGRDMLAADESEAVTAWLVQALGVRALVAERYDSDLSDEMRAVLEAYADGLNYYAALHPHERGRDLFPVTGEDVAVLSAFYSPMFYGLGRVLADLVAPDRPREAGRGQELQVFWLEETSDSELGSNAFAVAPHRSEDGATRLIINSHQPVEGPVAWYEAHMITRDGRLDFAGGTFPGSPVLHLGANPRLGHAATVNAPDLIDLYELVLSDDGRRYRLDGEWIELEIEPARMLVHLWGPFAWQVTRPVERSAHGPVIRNDQGAFALRHATHDDIRSVEQAWRSMQARDLSEYHAAMEMLAMGNTNRIAADRDGRIARYYGARLPLRLEEPGLDWSGVIPGDRSDLIWTQFAPLDALPHMIDPEAGYVLEANHTPFIVTGTDEDPDQADFPQSFGIETRMTNRALRAVELMASLETVSREALLAVKFDDAYHPESEMMALRRQLLAMDWDFDPALQEAARVIALWDGRTDRENRQAALAVKVFAPITTAPLLGIEPPPLTETFPAAVERLMTHFGTLEPEWGKVNRLVRGEASIAVSGGPDVLRAVYPAPQEDGTYRMAAGDGLMFLAEWLADGEFALWAVHQFGSSNRPDSPHFTDQMDMFAAHDWRRVPMGEDAVRAAAVEIYRPGAR